MPPSKDLARFHEVPTAVLEFGYRPMTRPLLPEAPLVAGTMPTDAATPKRRPRRLCRGADA